MCVTLVQKSVADVHVFAFSVGAKSPLDLPESEFQLLHPLVNGNEMTWKYK